jgi:hypothetical protein
MVKKAAILMNIKLCKLLEVYQYFAGVCCLHLRNSSTLKSESSNLHLNLNLYCDA